MKLFRDLTLKRKLLLLNLSICAAVLVMSLAAVFVFQILTFRSSFKRDLATLAAVVADNSTAALAFKDAAGAAETINSLRAKPTVVAATLTTLNGGIFAQFGKEESAQGLAQFPVAGEFLFQNGQLLFTETVKLNGKNLGNLHLRADYRTTFLSLVGFYALVISGVALGSFGLAVFLSGKLGSIITQPVLQLAQTALVVGEQKDYSVRAPVTSGSDELGRLTGAFNQMLSRIEAQDQALKESQERFEVAIAGVNDGIWDWNLKTNEIFFSPQWKRILGYEDAEIENTFSSFEKLLHPDDVSRTLKALTDYLEVGRSIFEAEFRMREKSGQYRWILARATALRDAAHKPYRMAGSHTDINDRKRAEVEAQAAREKFESLVNSLDGIVWEADAITLRKLFVSKQAESILGYAAGIFLEEGDQWQEAIHPDDRDKTIEAWKRGAELGKPFQLECRAVTSDGRILWLRESISVLMEEGRPARLRGLTIDITRRKQAEAELARLNSELMTSSRQAGMAEVATGVLHNVGNVLNSVSVSATLVSNQLKESPIGNLCRAASMLREKNGHLPEFLTNDPKGRLLPDYFSAVSGQLAVEHEQLVAEMISVTQHIDHIKEIVAMQQSYAKVSGAFENLSAAELVEDALRMNTAAFERHNIDLVQDIDASAPLVSVDRHKVLQILINLIRNAKYAMDAHDSPSKQLTVQVQSAGPECVKIIVRDNGVGIAPENITRIFSHGFTTKKDGHGFGLHSGANAAREIGGNLTAQSDGLGKGATFILELPVPARTPNPIQPSQEVLL